MKKIGVVLPLIAIMLMAVVRSENVAGNEVIENIDAETKVAESEALLNTEQITVTMDMEHTDIVDLKEYQGGEIISKDYLDFENIDSYFLIESISDEIFARIYGLSFKEDCSTNREDLRYIKLLHYGFDGEIRVGEIIANEYIAEDLAYIFSELFLAEYPVEKVLLVDEYGADDNLSMMDNNSSCFNFRRIAGSSNLSKHSLGLAIDINPLYNPYIRTQNGVQVVEPESGAVYANRNMDFSYKIDTEDLCYQLFVSRGFTWGGSWNSVKDYQHFEKELPRE